MSAESILDSGSKLLWFDDVNKIVTGMRTHRDFLLDWFGNMRLKDRRDKLRAVIKDIFDAFQSLSRVYLCKLTAKYVSVSIKSSF